MQKEKKSLLLALFHALFGFLLFSKVNAQKERILLIERPNAMVLIDSILSIQFE